MKQNINLKDKIILFSWIAGLLIIISLFWILTQGVQTRYLLRTVNNVFINNDDPRRVSAFIPKKSGNAGSTDLMGYWYSLSNSQDLFFVFTVFQDGILIPLGAVVSSGFVIDVIPLSAHAEQVFSKIPQSILQMYIRRIEMEGIR